MLSPVIVWLRQDLRLADHPALIAAATQGPVIFLYVLDDETPGEWKIGAASRWWLHRSLQKLAERVPLVLRRGAADRVIGEIVRETGANAVHFTRDYAPRSGALEQRLRKICEDRSVSLHRHGGFLLHEPEAVRNGSGDPYKVYTPFSKACFKAGEPPQPKPVPEFVLWKGNTRSDLLEDWNLLPAKPNWAKAFEKRWTPGEEGARQRLKAFIEEHFDHYTSGRDRPGQDGTSRLSPHLHFGEIGPAQCWHAIRAAQAEANGRLDATAEKFLKELLWREFNTHLLFHFPSMPTEPFKPAFANFPWSGARENLRSWQQGRTGYPIVDAGLRELWTTGFMQNRVRMIAASVLIKNLLISWVEGERWFWDTLVDADLANNAANWQWVAGSGADASPFFRIFNPVLQGEKFDPQGDYVRQWVPELSKLPNSVIHRPWEARTSVLVAAGVELGRNYPHPLVEHGAARDKALAAYRQMKGLL